MEKFKFDRGIIDIYITNVCNLTCTDCRSFNNHKFKGHIEYNRDLHMEWAQRIDIPSFGVIGGEPCLHPNLLTWLRGLRECWPDADANLITNGTYLSRVRGLHETLAELGYVVQVVIHGQHLRSYIADQMLQAFGVCEVLPPSIDDDYTHNTNLIMRTSLGVKINVLNSWKFAPMSNLGLTDVYHNSDPDRAHDACFHKHCTHFIDGKFYKCSVTARLGEFLRQHNRPVPDLLDAYEPLTLENLSQERIDALHRTIPQCSLCPEQVTAQSFSANFKQPQILRRFQRDQIAVQS